jgi:hypothetical protein
VTRRSGRPIAPPALSGASSESTRASAPDTRRNRPSARMKPPIFRRRTIGSGAAKASPPSRCRSARAAPIASVGVDRRGDSTPSTVATCRWPGGLRRGSAPAMRRARFPSRDRGRSGARRKARTFAPRACGGAPPNIRRRDDRLAFQARKTPRKPPSRTRLANALLLKFEFATFSGPPRPIYLERHDTMAVGRFDCPAIRRRE